MKIKINRTIGKQYSFNLQEMYILKWTSGYSETSYQSSGQRFELRIGQLS